MWEVFDSTHGKPLVTTRFRWLARALALMLGGSWDYAKAGEGWIERQ